MSANCDVCGYEWDLSVWQSCPRCTPGFAEYPEPDRDANRELVAELVADYDLSVALADLPSDPVSQEEQPDPVDPGAPDLIVIVSAIFHKFKPVYRDYGFVIAGDQCPHCHKGFMRATHYVSEIRCDNPQCGLLWDNVAGVELIDTGKFCYSDEEEGYHE